jgi:hypothetical protein
LRVSSLGGVGCEEIVNSGILKRLKMLDLRHGRITDRGAKILAACPDLAGLEWLDLGANAIGEAGLAALQATGVPADLASQHPESDVIDPETGEEIWGAEDEGYLWEGEGEFE